MLRTTAILIGDALLCVLAAGCHCHVAREHQAGRGQGIPDDLIKQADATKRAEWYPAVDKLGALARGDPSTRRVVWSGARVNSVGVKFAEIPPGAFVMGPSAIAGGTVALWHPQRARNAHTVEITKEFFISVTEVTNAQFELLFPEHEPHPRSPLPDCPVIGVSWEETVEFCKRLSEREGARYRLPTEAEWEYACRAGSTTEFCFGDDPALLEEYAWYGRYHDNAARVASLKPNAWGLYDMHGNALEWTSDWYRADTYALRATPEAVIRDPLGPASGSGHVLRGGDWRAWEPSALRSSKRATLPLFPSSIELLDSEFPMSHEVTGFRIVREGEK